MNININRLFPKGSKWEAEGVSTKHTFNGKVGGTRQLEVRKVIKGYVDFWDEGSGVEGGYTTLNTNAAPVLANGGTTAVTMSHDLRSVICIYRRIK